MPDGVGRQNRGPDDEASTHVKKCSNADTGQRTEPGMLGSSMKRRYHFLLEGSDPTNADDCSRFCTLGATGSEMVTGVEGSSESNSEV